MNVVSSGKVIFFSHKDYFDSIRHHLEAFWRFRCQDPDVSFRLIPDEDKTLDLFSLDKNIFKQNNDPLIF